MIDLNSPTTLPDAQASLEGRAVMAGIGRTADFDRMSVELRRQGFFSAGVESARFLEAAKREIQKSVNQFGTNRDRATFVANLQELATQLGIRPSADDAARGTIQDIGSARRLRLIFDVQTGLAFGENYWRSGMDPDVLNAFPVLELLRVSARQEPRDWPRRWLDAIQDLGESTRAEYVGGRMLAPKTDPIWTFISRFGLPWPPFDFNSGMGVEQISRREAIRLGVIEKGERFEPMDLVDVLDGEDSSAVASTRGLSDEVAGQLADRLSPLGVRVRGDVAEVARDGVAPIGPALRVVQPPDDEWDDSAFHRAIRAISKVHGEGALPTTDVVRLTDPGAGRFGTYLQSESRTVTPSILLRSDSPVPNLVPVHETAHLLDNFGFREPSLGDFNESSRLGGAFSEVLAAAFDSPTLRRLAPLRESSPSVEVALEPAEVWARSYTQFIAEQSGDDALMDELEGIRSGEFRSAGVPPHFAWGADEFLPIGRAINDLFQRLGWLSEI